MSAPFRDLIEDLVVVLEELLEHPAARTEGDLHGEVYRVLRLYFTDVELEIASLPDLPETRHAR